MSINIEPYVNQDLDELAKKEQVIFPHFDSDVAWKIGTVAKDLALKLGLSKAILIDVTTADGVTFFHSPSKPTTVPDNEFWVQRKRRTVLRFGYSSWYMGEKLRSKGNVSLQEAFFIDPLEYATHGGAVPIRIAGFGGVIAVLTISGLKQEEDHALAIDVLKRVAESL